MINIRKFFLLSLPFILFCFCVTTSYAEELNESKDFSKKKEKNLQKYKGKHNNSITRYYLAADYARRNNDPKSAVTILVKALKDNSNDPDLIRKTYMTMIISGDVKESIILARKYLEFEPESAEANIIVAIDNIKQNKFLKAGENLNLISFNDYSETSDINKIVADFLRISIKAGQGKYKEALDYTKKIAKKENVPSLFLRYHRAILNDLSGDIQAAEKNFQHILKSDITIPYHLAKTAGNFYRRIGKNDIAEGIYVGYNNKNPEFKHFQKELISLNSSASPREKIIKNAPYAASEILQEAARVLYSSRYSEKGIFYLNLSKYLRPKNDEATILLSKYYENSQRYLDAIENYETIKTNSDFYISSRINIAENLYILGQKEKSISRLYDLIEYSKKTKNNYKIVSLTLAEILRKEQRYLDTIKIYNDITNNISEPSIKDWPIFFARGICHERSEKWPMAEKDLLLALELKPDQAEILNYLGYSWIDRDTNIEKAIKMIKKAVESRPDDAQIIDSMGWALYKIGSFEEAIQYLEKATQITPYDPVINDHLGDAFWKVGRYNEAIFQWNRTIKYHKDSKDVSLDKVEKKIKEGLK